MPWCLRVTAELAIDLNRKIYVNMCKMCTLKKYGKYMYQVTHVFTYVNVRRVTYVKQAFSKTYLARKANPMGCDMEVQGFIEGW